VAIVAVLALFLHDLPWLVPVRAALHAGGPYALVALLGGIVGLAEVWSTFAHYPRETLRTRWALLLILVNASAAALAFGISRIVAPDTNPALLVVGVGIGFQALIRTQFTLAKQLGGSGGDISFNMGWLYDQFQHLCKTQIDLELMKGRRTAVTRLLVRYPTLRELHGIATYTIMARTTLTPEEQKGRLSALDALLDPKVPSDVARTSMALRILENGGAEYVDLLLGQPEVPMPARAPPESLVKQLIDKYSLLELVQVAKQLTVSPEVHTWIEQAAAANDAPEASRKGAIAHALMLTSRPLVTSAGFAIVTGSWIARVSFFPAPSLWRSTCTRQSCWTPLTKSLASPKRSRKMPVIQRGRWLSLRPVTPKEWAIVMRLGKLST